GGQGLSATDLLYHGDSSAPLFCCGRRGRQLLSGGGSRAMRTRSETGVFICSYFVFNSNFGTKEPTTPGPEFKILSATNGDRRYLSTICTVATDQPLFGLVFRCRLRYKGRIIHESPLFTLAAAWRQAY